MTLQTNICLCFLFQMSRLIVLKMPELSLHKLNVSCYLSSFLVSDEAAGTYTTTFGDLFNDDRCANIFEALVGTLRAAKRKKIVSYEGELLLQGVHDKVAIVLLQPDE